MSRLIPQEIQEINETLERYFGKHDNNLPKYRVAWSEDQFEHRYGTYQKVSEHGVWLGEETGFKFVPKYRQWLPEQWVLESLESTESTNELTSKLSYEPLFPFRHLPPDLDICLIVIKQVIEQKSGRQGYRKYGIPEEELQTKEAQLARVEKIEKYLFEDESNLSARLRFREAVVNPGLPSQKAE